MKVISVLNHKGGVGKTTFTGSTAQALALIGFRVLAIDNDSQHNLSTLLGVGAQSPSIRDVFRASPEKAPETFIRSIRKTELPSLHLVTANRDLCDGDVAEVATLAVVLDTCKLERYYDYLLIDNAPGLDRLQGAAIRASQEIFVPTELRQFAVDGILEMEQLLALRYPGCASITRIIPNFYRGTKRHLSFVEALNRLFPGRVTATAIPADAVFDEVVTGGKILFLHRLYSNGAAHYLKLAHELFDLDEEKIWNDIVERRKERISEEARARFLEQQANGGFGEKQKR
jgi:chromosome partitioning protein